MKRCILEMPALETQTSMPPCRRTTPSATDFAWAASVTSRASAVASPPSSFAVASAAARSRSVTTTVWSLAASSAAMARPMPDPAPVTTAIFLVMTRSWWLAGGRWG